jgi:superfamily II DNA or RNA helicase
MIIEILNPIECRIKAGLAAIIRPCLSYTAVTYIQGPYKKIRKEYQKSTLTKDDEGSFYFYTGCLQRVLNYCKEKNVPIEVKGGEEKLTAGKFSLKTLTLREEQIGLVEHALIYQRGVVKAPTGIGKTAVGLAIISAFPKAVVLWLCHTKDLMYQAGGVAEKELGVKVGYIGDGHQDLHNRITMATRQSFILYSEEYGHLYDIVIVDETHHLSSITGQYADILTNVLAPVRIGLTATLPTSEESLLAIESFLGPLIDEVTVAEGQELGIMADIKIKFLKVPLSHKIKELRKYQDVYEWGVVKREAQHKLIAETVLKEVTTGNSVLVIVNRIDHGYNLLSAISALDVTCCFAQGATDSDLRKKIKDALNQKDIHCVIATTIWKEGVDLPELNVIINAAGGKSEIGTLQAIGRGLRLTKTKKQLILYDIFDPSNNFFISHFGERVCLYSDMNWV